MFKIEQDQFDQLRNAQEDQFIESLANLTLKLFPRLARTLTENERRAAAEASYEDAHRNEITQKGPIRFWMQMSMMFGSGFATDPQYPELAKIFEETVYVPGMYRSERLHEWSLGHTATVSGPNSENVVGAWRALRRTLEEFVDFDVSTFQTTMLDTMYRHYPAKFDTCVHHELVELINETVARSRRKYGFESAQDHAQMVMLAYAFGHEFDCDPFLPWIKRCLTQANVESSSDIAGRLRSTTILWLDAALTDSAFAPSLAAG